MEMQVHVGVSLLVGYKNVSRMSLLHLDIFNYNRFSSL